MTRLEAAEMRFLRSVKGYTRLDKMTSDTRLDKMRSEVTRKELEISGIQDVREPNTNKTGSATLKEWIIPDFQNTLNYKPRGRRDRGCPRKLWQRVDAGTGQLT
jgi:hypothetical protein